MKRNKRIVGTSLSLSSIVLWALTAASLFLFRDDSVLQVVVGASVMTFLYTGLFIVAHDAMHGSAAPGDPRLNDLIGTTAMFCYAGFSFRSFRQKHRDHHARPTSGSDPDSPGVHPGMWRWYLKFLRAYFTWGHAVALPTIFNIFHHGFGISLTKLLGIWVLPSMLSSFQLFYFGTYLPHKKPDTGHANVHCARSSGFSVFWSFLTCYHFGYHLEHHAFPDIPWWKLPRVVRMKIA